jgi:hypothetical protein
MIELKCAWEITSDNHSVYRSFNSDNHLLHQILHADTRHCTLKILVVVFIDVREPYNNQRLRCDITWHHLNYVK